MIGEILAYYAGRSAGRNQRPRSRRRRRITRQDVIAMRMVALVFLVCAGVVVASVL